MAKITVDLNDDQHERFVTAKLRRKEKSLQSLMIGATERLLDDASGGDGSAERPRPNTASAEDLPWPKDVRDGEELVREFIALLKHPAPGDKMGGGGMRRHIIEHLRDRGLREDREQAKSPKT